MSEAFRGIHGFRASSRQSHSMASRPRTTQFWGSFLSQKAGCRVAKRAEMGGTIDSLFGLGLGRT